MTPARAYLDHASTSPLRPEARHAMVEALASLPGDPGRIHEEGLAARVALETAREQVAELVGARPRSVVFTSGATEAIGAAVWGATERARAKDPGARVHQVVTAVEHSAVRRWAERSGDVTVVPVDGGGPGVEPTPCWTPSARTPPPCTCSGATTRWERSSPWTRWWPAAASAACSCTSTPPRRWAGCRSRSTIWAPTSCRSAGTSSAVRRAPEGCSCAAGCGCRRCWWAATRSGPGEPGSNRWPRWWAWVPAAAVLADADRLADEAALAVAQTDRIRAGLAELDGVTTFGDAVHRLPHLVCAGVDGVEPQGVLLGLDRAGVAAHSGSSCSSESLEPSPVLEAMGVDAHRSLRLSVGWSTTDADVDRLLGALPDTIGRLRQLAAGR